ncbi:hypothetical protein IJH01_01400 [Candidatus Saccharibacteria bacterium]|nr:hypothetical protein [Candidatus Saccharibacteria bacterium]
MAQAKKKTATKTKKASTQRKTGSRANTRTCKKKCVSSQEKMHIYIVTAMAIIAGVLLCANAAMMMA